MAHVYVLTHFTSNQRICAIDRSADNWLWNVLAQLTAEQ